MGDKCMGSNRFRVICLSIIVGAYCALAVASAFESIKSKLKGAGSNPTAAVFAAALLITLACCGAALLIQLFGWDNGIIKGIVGFLFIVGGGLLFVKACLELKDGLRRRRLQLTQDQQNQINNAIGNLGNQVGNIGNQINNAIGNALGSTLTAKNAMLASNFIEIAFPAFAAVFIGLDFGFKCCESENVRLFSNLLLLGLVGSIVSICNYISGSYSAGKAKTGQLFTGIGYMAVGGSAIFYVIVFMFSCCCNCKDSRWVRWFIAICLIGGAAFIGIGKYIAISGSGAKVVETIGFTVVAIGLPVVWAIDLFVDDDSSN